MLFLRSKFLLCWSFQALQSQVSLPCKAVVVRLEQLIGVELSWYTKILNLPGKAVVIRRQAILFFSPFSVVRPTQIFRIFKKKSNDVVKPFFTWNNSFNLKNEHSNSIEKNRNKDMNIFYSILCILFIQICECWLLTSSWGNRAFYSETSCDFVF